MAGFYFSLLVSFSARIAIKNDIRIHKRIHFFLFQLKKFLMARDNRYKLIKNKRRGRKYS